MFAPTVDLGFRIDGRKGNTPVGALVVRINGEWVEAEWWKSAASRSVTRNEKAGKAVIEIL